MAKHTMRDGCLVAAVAVFFSMATAALHANPLLCDREVGCAAPAAIPGGVTNRVTFFTSNSSSAVSGELIDDQLQLNSPFASGTPRSTVTGGKTQLDAGSNAPNVKYQTTLMPVTSVFASADAPAGLAPIGQSSITNTLTYLVNIHAADAAHAATLKGMLTTSGAIANVSGTFAISASPNSDPNGLLGTATSLAFVLTGIRGQNDLFLSGGGLGQCASGVLGGNVNCGTGSFAFPVNFVDSSGFTNATPLDFYSLISLEVTTVAGNFDEITHDFFPGSATAFIDPVIALADGLDPNFFALTVGDGRVSNLRASPTAVAEPNTWLMMLLGIASLGYARQRAYARGRCSIRS